MAYEHNLPHIPAKVEDFQHEVMDHAQVHRAESHSALWESLLFFAASNTLVHHRLFYSVVVFKTKTQLNTNTLAYKIYK